MTEPRVSVLPFHYGWIIVVTGMLCVFACLGFGRFALGMLLPSMASTLRLSYAEIGFISTGNFLGYLIAVFVSGFWAIRLGARGLIFIALVIIGVSMALISRAESFISVLTLYTITGMGSGAANVPMMGLVSSWFDSKMRGRAAGFIVIGSGFAIILSGKLIPAINTIKGPEGWRTNWMVLAGVVMIVALLCLLLLRNKPSELGLHPAGSDTSVNGKPEAKPHPVQNIYSSKVIYLLGTIYFFFGYTYVIYATFIVTTLVKERGFSEALAGNFWAWVGFLSLFSGPVFGTLSDRLGRKEGLTIVFSLQMLSYLLVALRLPTIFLYLSIFFFGIVAWSIPSIMVAAVADHVGPDRALAAFGFITFIFGIGQIIGPAIAGVFAESTGTFSSSFFMAAALAGVAILLTRFLKQPRPA
ncbi:MAG: MFS transporter [bacterium]